MGVLNHGNLAAQGIILNPGMALGQASSPNIVNNVGHLIAIAKTIQSLLVHILIGMDWIVEASVMVILYTIDDLPKGVVSKPRASLQRVAGLVNAT